MVLRKVRPGVVGSGVGYRGGKLRADDGKLRVDDAHTGGLPDESRVVLPLSLSLSHIYTQYLSMAVLFRGDDAGARVETEIVETERAETESRDRESTDRESTDRESRDKERRQRE